VRRVQPGVPLLTTDGLIKVHRRLEALTVALETPLREQHPDWPWQYMALEGQKQPPEFARVDHNGNIPTPAAL